MTPAEYILSEEFECILCAVQEDYADPYIVDGPNFQDFLKTINPRETLVITYNALFDCSILAWRYNFVPGYMLDALGMARALLGYALRSFTLENVAKSLQLGVKEKTILKVKGMHRVDIIAAGLWAEFQNYAKTDVRLCSDIFFKLWPGMLPSERRFMDLVLRTTIEPKFIADTELLERHLAEVIAEKNALLEPLGMVRQANGKPPTELMSTNRFKALLEERGVDIEYKPSPRGDALPEVPCFAKTDEFMQSLLDHEDEYVRQLAEARLGFKSTLEETRSRKFLAISKLPWPKGCVPARAMPMPLAYGKAHTHRLSGDWGMNCQNLPTTMKSGGKSKLRHALQAPPGHQIVVADLAQIEARLGAWLARCEDLLMQFRDGTDPYAIFATSVFGYNVDKKTHPFEREVGKTGVLGLGYGCGWVRFHAMLVNAARSRGFDVKLMTPELAQKTVQTFRTRYVQFVRAWKELDFALMYPWRNRAYNLTVKGAYIVGDKYREMNFRNCIITPFHMSNGKYCCGVILPNGLSLLYGDPQYHEDFYDKNANRIVNDISFTFNGRRHKMYGAKFFENIDQALARIILSDAAVRLADRHGLRFALQLHDELVYVVPENKVEETKAVVLKELTVPPAWAPDLPLAAEVMVGRSYGEAKQ